MAVRCALLFNVSPLFESIERREEYTTLLSLCSFRILSFFHFGAPTGTDRIPGVAWAWRFCDWSRPARRFGKETSVFQAFRLDEFATLEELLKEELMQQQIDTNVFGHVGTVRDLSLALTHLTGSLPWDLPELTSPSKSHHGCYQRVEMEQSEAKMKNYIFVLQPCPRTDSQWTQFCGNSSDTLKESLFTPALHTQLQKSKQIVVHWVDTTLPPQCQEGALAKELRGNLAETLASCGGSIISSSLLISAGSAVGSGLSLHYLPVSAVLSHFLSPVVNSSQIEGKKFSWLCSSAGKPICILEVCGTYSSSCRELKMQQRSKSKIRKHADNKCENTIPFPICLVMEKTWKKTRLAVPMDYVSRTWSFSCIGLEPSVHNEFQTVQNRTLRSGTKYVEGKISFTDQSEMTGSDALKKLPNPSVHLETVGRMQSKQFESLLLLLSQKQLLLVLHSWDSQSVRYILDPTTSNSASLHLLKENMPRPEYVYDTTELGHCGGELFDCVESWYRLMPHYGVNHSTMSHLKQTLSSLTRNADVDIREAMIQLKTAYRDRQHAGGDRSESMADGGSDKVASIGTADDAFSELKCQMHKVLELNDMNVKLNKSIPDAFKLACDKLKCVSDTPERELYDFVSKELLLSADQLKTKYQRDSANKGIREKEHQLQVLIRFELALLKQSKDTSDLFSECVAILRVLPFISNAESLSRFLDETILPMYGDTVRDGVLAVYGNLIPEPTETSMDTVDSSASEEDRRERLMSLRSYTLVSGPSGPKPPSVDRKFARHRSFHDYGKQREISVPIPHRKKLYKEEAIRVALVTRKTDKAAKMKRRSQTAAEILRHKDERSRRAVRRTLFSSLTDGCTSQSQSPRSQLKRALTFGGQRSLGSPENKRVTRHSAENGCVMVEDTPLKQGKSRKPRSRKMEQDTVTAHELSQKIVPDTPKRNFYSRSFSVGSLTHSQSSYTAKTFGKQSSTYTDASNAASEEFSILLKTVVESNGIEARRKTDMAGIMFQQQEVLLGPAVGQTQDRSTPKGPSPLHLSKLLQSPMRYSPLTARLLMKKSPMIPSTTAPTDQAVVFDTDDESTNI